MKEYFQKIKSLFLCTYLYFDVFEHFVRHTILFHPRSLPFPLKVPKSLCAEFNLNILYLTEIMLDFFFCKNIDGMFDREIRPTERKMELLHKLTEYLYT